MNRDPLVYRVERLDMKFAPKPWAYAIERRVEIDAYFAELQREKPEIWNGRVLLLHSRVLAEGAMRGEYFETDYASFAFWCHLGKPSAGKVHDCFASAAIVSADGAFLLGTMAPHTFNAGQIYFPGGTPDPSDIIDGKVDLEFSARRELNEETGLDPAEFVTEPGWTAVIDGGLIVMIKVFRSDHAAEELRARILSQLAQQKQPEFSSIGVVRGPADFGPAMRPFVTAFLTQRFAGGQ